MKFALLVSFLFNLNAFAGNLPWSIECSNDRGIELIVRFKPEIETTMPWFDVEEKYGNKTLVKFEAYMTKSTATEFQVKGSDPENEKTLMFVGYTYSKKSGYEAYLQKAPNNGMSSLPPIFFTDCKVVFVK